VLLERTEIATTVEPETQCGVEDGGRIELLALAIYRGGAHPTVVTALVEIVARGAGDPVAVRQARIMEQPCAEGYAGVRDSCGRLDGCDRFSLGRREPLRCHRVVYQRDQAEEQSRTDRRIPAVWIGSGHGGLLLRRRLDQPGVSTKSGANRGPSGQTRFRPVLKMAVPPLGH